MSNSVFVTAETVRQVEQTNDLVDLFPPVLVEGHLVHVFEEGGEFSVWLNTEDMAFTGLCIGVGKTREEAVAQAVAVCEAVGAYLQTGQ